MCHTRFFNSYDDNDNNNLYACTVNCHVIVKYEGKLNPGTEEQVKTTNAGMVKEKQSTMVKKKQSRGNFLKNKGFLWYTLKRSL